MPRARQKSCGSLAAKFQKKQGLNNVFRMMRATGAQDFPLGRAQEDITSTTQQGHTMGKPKVTLCNTQGYTES